MILKANAIVIKSFPYSETSLISRLLLDNGEKMTIMIKGARSLKSNKNALFQSINLIDMSYYYKENREIQLFKEGTLIKDFSNLKKDFKRMKYALSIIDIIDKVLPKGYKDQSMFDISYKSLSEINDINNYKIIFIFFLLAFSHYNGYSVNHLKFNSINSEEALDLFINNDMKQQNSQLRNIMHGINIDDVIKQLLLLIRTYIPEIKNVKSLKFIL